MKKILIICLIFLIITTLGCSKEKADNESENKVKVAVSIVPQATFVKAVGGGLIEVVTMIPPGNSPANYQATPKQMEDLSKASIYFAIGVPTERINILPEIKDFNSEIRVVDLSKPVEAVYPIRYFSDVESHEHGDENSHEAERDQHIWLSPKRVKIMVEKITEELSIIDPDNSDTYQSNSVAYIDKLDALDKEISETVSKMSGKSFLIYHPAFGYFADDYGLEMIPVEKIGKEATAKELLSIIKIAKAKNIKIVFYQAEIDSKQSKVLADELDGKAVMLAPLAPNYINNLRQISEIFKDVLQ